MSLYLVRVDGNDIAVVAPTMQMAIDAVIERVLEENEGDEEADRDWARSLIDQVVNVGAETVLIVDRKSWMLFSDDGISDWRPMPEGRA